MWRISRSTKPRTLRTMIEQRAGFLDCVGGVPNKRKLTRLIQSIPNETRFFAVRDRTAATLLNLIQNHVALGRQIWSDCWRSYSRIAQLPEQYIHLTVNHSEHFTDPMSGVNTNAIEAAWSRLRHKIVRTKRGVRKELRYHLAEHWWKSLQRVLVTGGNQHKTKTHPRIFTNFLNLISRTYPL
uniref:ISXO2-like transposase domain-containing protein n=1 Tax=Plectus sambesii TaxID=2011161 RepID=A0A914VYD1_9BILA